MLSTSHSTKLGYGALDSAATVAYESLKHREVLRMDALLIVLWRDNEIGKTCQQAIKAHLIKNGFEILAVKP